MVDKENVIGKKEENKLSPYLKANNPLDNAWSVLGRDKFPAETSS